MNFKDLAIDTTWSLFLDRDGVICRKIEKDYVRNWSQFEFLPDSLKALKNLAALYARIIVVTNQQGVGKSLYSEKELQFIHHRMIENISRSGGRIDAIYYCPHRKEDYCECRKPRNGMALFALRDDPAIVFEESIMVGDSESDLKMGKSLGMTTVLVGNTVEQHPLADFIYPNLADFASACSNLRV